MVVFSAAINVLALAAPIYMLQVYDRVIPSRHIDTLLALSIMLVAALLVYAILDAARIVILNRLSRWIEGRLVPVVLARTIALATATGASTDAQSLRDLNVIRSAASGPAAIAFLDLPWLPLFYVVLFILHPLIGLVVLVGGFASFGVTVLNELATRRAARTSSGAQVEAARFSDRIVQNAEVVEAMGMLPALVAKRSAIDEGGERADRDVNDVNAIYASITRFLRYGLQSGILGLAAFLVVQDALSPSSIIAASVISARALAPLDQLVGTWKMVGAARSSWERLRALFDRIPEAEQAMPLPAVRGRLEADKVAWGPSAGDKPILRNVSFIAEPGEVIGIIGPSGCGKTSLVRLLVGSLLPMSGVVRLDSAEIRRMCLADRAKYVGYLPQDVKLFPGTVRENIARFSDFSVEAILEASSAAGAHEMILSLSKGYETRIGEGAQVLSGGQRQRIGLSRALIGRPALVVLDEPNANLDLSGEQALHRAIEGLKKSGSTVVLVTQRAAALTFVDKVLVLNEGVVQLYGKREEVLARLRPVAVAGQR
jgi:PrtD family type I secretion system ABC transporter